MIAFCMYLHEWAISVAAAIGVGLLIGPTYRSLRGRP